MRFSGDTKKSLSELSQTLAKDNGVMPELPDWVYTGAVVGLQGGTTRVRFYL